MADHGVKCNTSCLSVYVGVEAIASLVIVMVDETSVYELEGAPSLNGLGDLVVIGDHVAFTT